MSRDQWPDDFDDGRTLNPGHHAARKKTRERQRIDLADQARALNTLFVYKAEHMIDLPRTKAAREDHIRRFKLKRSPGAHRVSWEIVDDPQGLPVFMPVAKSG